MIRDSVKQRPHERLDVWRGAVALVEQSDRLTATIPDTGRLGLAMQLRRIPVSVPSDIAEGGARRSSPDHLRFPAMVRGSPAGISTQIEISRHLGFTQPNESTDELMDRAFARPNALIRSLESSPRGVRETPAPYESPITNPESHAR